MKQRLINYLLSYLLNTVTPQDIITVNKGKVEIDGKEISPTEMRSLIAEVQALESMRLWSIMNETLRAEAMDRGFNKSTTYEHLNTAKLMLYNLDIFNSICRIIKSQEQK